MRSAASITFALAGLCAQGVFACSSETFVSAPRPSDAGLDAHSSVSVLDASGEAATDANTDATPVADGGTAWLRCGTSFCRAPEETCCVDNLQTGTLSAFLAAPEARGHCVAAAACAAPDISFGCYDPTSCGARGGGADAVCCVTNDGVSGFTSAYCATQATCDSAGPRDILCDPTAPSCPSAYPQCLQQLVEPFTVDTFGVCRP